MKSKRQRKILELIKKNVISTQEELVDLLKQEGLNVTQATVSRDIKDLRLIKVSIGDEKYKYAVPKEQIKISEKKLRFMLKEFVLKIDYSENLIVIKTPPGNANAVASVIDNSHWEEIIGTIAGDDNILLIIKPKDAVKEIINRLKSYMG